MKPLISYYGGKQRMASKIVPLLPEHTVYVEPFAGGAAVLFAKPWPDVGDKDHYREVINDSCGDLINLYRMAQERPEELAHRIDFTAYSQTEHARASAILRRKEPADDMLRALAYYSNIQQSFSRVKHAGWCRAVYGRNAAATWHTRDFWGPMERLPYPGANQGHYGGYTSEDYGRLVAALDACQGSFVLSQYDVPGAEIPASWERFAFAAQSVASGNGRVKADRSRAATSEELGDRRRTEVVYRRFNRVAWRPELERLRQAGKYACFARRPGESATTAPLFAGTTAGAA